MTNALVHVNRGSFSGVPEALLERAVRLALERGRPPERVGRDVRGPDRAGDPSDPAGAPPDRAAPPTSHAGELSLTLLSDDEIADLNERYLGRRGPTDVVAFSLGEPGAPLGDVYVGYEQAVRQAREHDVPLDEELARLAIHGTLHVLGHDHPDGPERAGSAMFALQERLLGELMERAR